MKQQRRRRPFVDLRSAEILTSFAPRLFLGRFEKEALQGELEAAGIFRALQERGYPDTSIDTEYEGGQHRLRIDPASGQTCLVDLRLSEGATLADEPLLRGPSAGVLSFLTVHWLSLQDPAREFTADRPRLPGQRHPGLGLARPMIELLLSWARQWGKDGLLVLPEYYHNAVFYSPLFQFLSPLRQGRFEALRRDLALLHVAQASFALEQARVVEEPWGAPVRWEAGEMVAPLTEALRRHLESVEYVSTAAKTRDGVRFRSR